MFVRPLGPDDRGELARFSCSSGTIWSREIEEVIQSSLAAELAHGRTEAAGVFVDGRLAALNTWSPSTVTSMTCLAKDPTRWTSSIVAVAHGHRGRGYGKLLKGRLLERARECGAISVTSYVHEDNGAMIQINKALGGRFTRDPATTDWKPSPYLIFEFRF